MSQVNVIEPLLASCGRQPQRLAVVGEGRELTYREFVDEVNRCAHVLVEDLGVKAGDRVAYLLPNSVAILEVFYAIQEIGAVAVPINVRHIAREIAYLLGASGSSVLIWCERFEDKVLEALDQMEQPVKTMAARGPNRQAKAPVPFLEDTMAAKPSDSYAFPARLDELTRIQFTGGSTGLPKGAARTHRQDLVELLGVLDSNDLCSLRDKAVVLVQCPLEHHGGHSWFTAAFAAGATLVVCADFDEENVLSQIQRYGVTHMILLPPVTYLRLFAWPQIGDYDLSSVRLVQSAAGASNTKVLAGVFEHFPNAEFNYGWGQSESGLGTTNRVTRQMFEACDAHILSVGRPMKGIELRIVDDEDNELPNGQPGEALVRGGCVMSGYYGQPELDEQVFLPDGWMRTGDVMTVDEQGYYSVCSRKKDVIKSGGENVFIGEVELAINSHPEVSDCVVFGTSDPVMGEAVAAVVQRTPGATLSAFELQQHCKRCISSYKKPRYIMFVDSLGKDDAGKVRKSKLVERFEQEKDAAFIS